MILMDAGMLFLVSFALLGSDRFRLFCPLDHIQELEVILRHLANSHRRGVQSLIIEGRSGVLYVIIFSCPGSNRLFEASFEREFGCSIAIMARSDS